MRTLITAAVIALVTGTVCAQTPVPVPPACPIPAQPIASGLNERPGEKIGQPQTPETYSSQQDYKWMHSSTNLQGYATTEKFAPCLFYNPRDKDLAAPLGGFRSALVVNNPSPTVTANVQVELRDRNGNPATTLSVTLGPNETWTRGVPELQSLANGVGSARIVSDQPIVGSSLHYLDSVLIGGTRITDPDFLHPGEGTMQQLQAAQPAGKSLYAGPMPLSNSSPFDFLNGNLPFYCVMNTAPTPTTITAFKGSSSGIAFPTLSATLPGYGQFIDMSLWQTAEAFYLTGTGALDDNAWAFVSSNQSPLVGELYLADFFAYGSPTSPSMSPGKKFRVGSAMMANTPSYGLTSAEVTQQTSIPLPRTDTLIGVLNASTTNIGPITVTYRNRNGGVAGTNTVASLLPGQTLRLTPGTPGFPASPFFDGWADIRACKAGLIGWTMREISINGSPYQFEKTYGEELVGANAREPGGAIRVVEQGIAVNRKVAPIARVSPGLAWPSYHNFVNNTVANVGNHWYRFFQVLPLSGDVTNYTPQPFVGLRYGNTSFSYQDGNNSLVNIGFDQNVSGRVDVTTGNVIGISAIGDPMEEWNIPLFPNGAPPLLKRR
ncbi:MAG: hypothetical protein HOP03_12500 [Lysobacter sp.]|nr:hypothetical protein [Lysobacter sp.]